jgi:tetratricopeptide (TPR) repeat protein
MLGGGCGEDAATIGSAAAPRAHTPPTLHPSLTPSFELIQQDDFLQARLRLQAHIEQQPNDGHAIFLFGLSFHREHRYDVARRHFELAAELAPDYPPLHHFLGWANYYLGEADAARAAFERHLQLSPGEGDSHFGIGLVDLDEDRLSDAEQRFRAAIELQREQAGRVTALATAHAKLGEALARQGRLDGARDHLESAVELYPTHYEALYQLSRVLARLGEDEASERALAAHHEARRRFQEGAAGERR